MISTLNEHLPLPALRHAKRVKQGLQDGVKVRESVPARQSAERQRHGRGSVLVCPTQELRVLIADKFTFEAGLPAAVSELITALQLELTTGASARPSGVAMRSHCRLDAQRAPGWIPIQAF